MKTERQFPAGTKSSSQAYEVLIDFGMHDVTGGACKAMFYVARRTVGFGKATDGISLSQICNGITTRDGRRLDYGTGLSRKAAVHALGELERRGYVDVMRGAGAETNRYRLNLDAVLCQKETSSGKLPVTSSESTPGVVAKVHTQETVQPTVVQATVKTDIDCPTTNRKKRDSRSGVTSVSQCRQYPKLREYLAQYMQESASDKKIYPTDRHVVEIMDASNGETEDEVCRCLVYLYNERGLRPGTKNGPRTFAWFPTVVAEYFYKQQVRDEAATPTGYEEWEERNLTREQRERHDRMTSAIELPDAVND